MREGEIINWRIRSKTQKADLEIWHENDKRLMPQIWHFKSPSFVSFFCNAFSLIRKSYFEFSFLIFFTPVIKYAWKGNTDLCMIWDILHHTYTQLQSRLFHIFIIFYYSSSCKFFLCKKQNWWIHPCSFCLRK